MCTTVFSQQTSRDEYTADRKYFLTKHFSRVTEIPRNIPADALEVLISENYITHVPANVFAHLSECVSLNIRGNQIATMDLGAFNGLRSVERLTLSGNDLTILQAGIFSGVPKCTALDLQSNSISVIEKGSFRGLPAIEWLFLNRNDLKHITKDMLEGLDSLGSFILSYANVETIEPGAFSHLHNLRKLDISFNALTQVTQQTFEGLYSLQGLDIEGNRFNTLDVTVLANIPRNFIFRLRMNNAIGTNDGPWDCESLCWLKYEETTGTIAWFVYSGGHGDTSPECANGVDWATFSCPGESMCVW